ncbi:MAG: hypothetical protein IT162_10265 [Bryobacterales bacterium]|nr:hypothetical protein [Bryobacterales bacterium]
MIGRMAAAGLWAALGIAQAQVWTVEADPDVYFDRGLTLAAGAKPAAGSRWTLLADFASRKIGPLREDTRLVWRAGGGARFRFYGQRSGPFVQCNLSADRTRTPIQTATELSARPGVGLQWFPWREKGFYVAPLLAMEHTPHARGATRRFEIRIGWQWGGQ